LKTPPIEARRVFLLALHFVTFLAFYFGTAHVAEAKNIQTPWITTSLDEWIPFVPSFVWVYMTAFVLAPVGITFCCWKIGEWDFDGILGACWANLIIFSFFHLMLPFRAVEPTLVGGGTTGATMRLIQVLTSQYNTFPSGHVSYALIVIWVARLTRRLNSKTSAILTVISVAVIISTLLVKQHTVLDVVGGFIVAGLAILVGKFLRRETLRSYFPDGEPSAL
jgi:membrane-associated phospholipid phosphatase